MKRLEMQLKHWLSKSPYEHFLRWLSRDGYSSYGNKPENITQPVCL